MVESAGVEDLCVALGCLPCLEQWERARLLHIDTGLDSWASELVLPMALQ